MGNVSYSEHELREAVKAAYCLSDVCRLLNVTICSFNNNRIRALCKQHSISTEHFDVKQTFRRNKKTWSDDDIFTEGSLVGRPYLRQLLKRRGHYTGVCCECGIGDIWNGKSLTIELDHINGICDDNRLTNLRWLCPNCHSQTPTHKNSRTRRKNSTE